MAAGTPWGRLRPPPNRGHTDYAVGRRAQPSVVDSRATMFPQGRRMALGGGPGGQGDGRCDGFGDDGGDWETEDDETPDEPDRDEDDDDSATAPNSSAARPPSGTAGSQQQDPRGPKPWSSSPTNAYLGSGVAKYGRAPSPEPFGLGGLRCVKRQPAPLVGAWMRHSVASSRSIVPHSKD